jgi:hypothetical protein
MGDTSQPPLPVAAASEPFPLAVLLFSVTAVFAMPLVVLLYAAYTGADHAPADLPAHARQVIERGDAVNVQVVAGAAEQPGRRE